MIEAHHFGSETSSATPIGDSPDVARNKECARGRRGDSPSVDEESEEPDFSPPRTGGDRVPELDELVDQDERDERAMNAGVDNSKGGARTREQRAPAQNGERGRSRKAPRAGRSSPR
eukprot:2028537-Pyramimonas_sp.AAC.1